MSSIGIERGMAGMPAIPPQRGNEVVNGVIFYSGGSLTTTAASAATGPLAAEVQEFYTDGDTSYDVTVTTSCLYLTSGTPGIPILSLFENGIDLGIIIRGSHKYPSLVRTVRRTPARGPVLYTARLWVYSGSPQAGIDSNILVPINPTRLTVNRVKTALA